MCGRSETGIIHSRGWKGSISVGDMYKYVSYSVSIRLGLTSVSLCFIKKNIFELIN